jgi:integrase/recombinase XerD
VNLENGEVQVLPYGSSIKSKPRTVYLGRAARRAIWLHIAEREDLRDDDPFFLLAICSIQVILRRLGERAGAKKVHAHRLRHTFVIQYLRNGGDVFTLQRLLGDSTLEMVKHYLAIAQADIKEAHRKSSPVDRWRL